MYWPQLRPSDRIFLWRYVDPPRSYAGWHFTGTATGCRVFGDILRALHPERVPSRSVPLSEPAERELSVPDCSAQVIAFDRLRVTHTTSAADWSIEEEGSEIELSLGSDGMTRLLAALDDIRIGRGDYTIGREEQPLWIWWRS